MPLRPKHWETAPPIISHRMASASWPGSSRSCWSMLGVLFLIFQRWLAGRLVGLPAGARNGEEGGVDGGTTRPKTDERARKGRLPNFFYFPLHFLCGDLLIVQTCLQCRIRNKCVGSRGRLRKKKKGVRCLKKKKKKNLWQRRQKNLEQQESLHANFPRTTNGCNRTEIPVDKWIQLFGPTKWTYS